MCITITNNMRIQLDGYFSSGFLLQLVVYFVITSQ